MVRTGRELGENWARTDEHVSHHIFARRLTFTNTERIQVSILNSIACHFPRKYVARTGRELGEHGRARCSPYLYEPSKRFQHQTAQRPTRASAAPADCFNFRGAKTQSIYGLEIDMGPPDARSIAWSPNSLGKIGQRYR